MTIISAILVLVLGSMANGAEWLTINGEDVASIDLTLGQSCTIEVVSDGDGLPYMKKLHTINFTLSDLELIEITPEAGTGASVAPAGDNAYTLTAGTGMVAGVHFVFSFTATSAGQKEVELKALLGGDPFASIVINVASAPVGTAFTYQGILNDGDSAADGEYDFEFKLYNSPITGDQIGSTVNKEDVSVDQGNFTVKLDFLNDPNVFNGQARWLEIGVRPANAISSFIPLSPRQELTPSPYALYALSGPGSTEFWAADGNDIYNTNIGNVGIGTSSPTNILELSSSSPKLYFNRQSSSTNLSGVYWRSTADNFEGAIVRNHSTGDIEHYSDYTGGTPVMVVTDYGRVGIGTTNPASKLSVGGRGELEATFSAVTEYDIAVYGYGSDNGPSHNYGGYFDARGVFGEGVYGISYGSAGKGLHGICYGENGVGVQGSGGEWDFYAVSGNYGSGSSIRWKRNIVEIDDPLEKLSKLRGVYFDWDAEHGGQRDVGMIAEEVGKVLPEIVSYEKNGVDAIAMDYSKLAPLLVEAIKVLKAEVNELKENYIQKDEAIEMLKEENQLLKKHLASMEDMFAKMTVRLEGSKQ
jgi:hypothetical protein